MAREKHSILIIEDDPDVRDAISDLLRMEGYDCRHASNGLEGLKEAKKIEPDLIVTDIMMPKMDGFEFVQKLFANRELAHIPVIIITAKASDLDKIEGLELGAVDYLTKPFNGRELRLKIRNIFTQQESYRTKNWQTLLTDSASVSPDDNKTEFVQSLYSIIVRELGSSSFGVSNLADHLNTSERNLYRKVKEYTGMTVATYIREIKLQRAHQLLTNDNTVTKAEVASKVGFKSPSHFKKVYKKRFG